MRALALPSGVSPREWGRIHGERFRAEIGSLADIRVYLAQRIGRFADRDEVLRVAAAHLPVLERYDTALSEELVGIAEGAATSPERIVVLNHYTDLRDIDPVAERGDVPAAVAGDPGGCSILYGRTAAGTVVAQTWDMHATAIPYTMMLRVPDAGERPGAWLFTLTGCLGMCGLGGTGVAVAINNLVSTDARVGLVWPALVRRALAEPSAADARELILRSPVGSGHHYLVADADAAFGVETSGTVRRVVYAGDPAHYVHTNHCVDLEVAERNQVPADSTTRERYQVLQDGLSARSLTGWRDAWQRLGSTEGYPRSVCTNRATPEDPHGTATCGGVAMEIGRGVVWAAAGLIHNVEPERFSLAAEAT